MLMRSEVVYLTRNTVIVHSADRVPLRASNESSSENVYGTWFAVRNSSRMKMRAMFISTTMAIGATILSEIYMHNGERTSHHV